MGSIDQCSFQMLIYGLGLVDINNNIISILVLVGLGLSAWVFTAVMPFKSINDLLYQRCYEAYSTALTRPLRQGLRLP